MDDAKVAKPLKAEKEMISFQDDLHTYYEWANQNNMEFSSSIFVALRYGKDNSIKEEYDYITNNWIKSIDVLESHKDLEIFMSALEALMLI